MSEQKTPNILVLMTDQHTAGALSCAGNADLATPGIDAIADAGTRFDRAYCTHPLCVPSRTSMITGLLSRRLGVISNHCTPVEGADRRPDLFSLFADSPYHCYYGGKKHLPTVPAQLPGWNLCFGPATDREAAQWCAEKLAEQKDNDNPFLMIASFVNPHDICPWVRNQPLPQGEIDEAALNDCPNLPANFPYAPYQSEALSWEQRNYRETEDWPPLFKADGFSADQWRRYRHAYYRLVEKVDREIAAVLDALKNSGLEDDTLVVFTSDHGDGLGAHHWNQKWALFEEVIRVPFIVKPPGRASEGVVDRDHLISAGLDLLPTLCDYAGLEIPADLDGLSVRPLLERRQAGESSWRDYLVAETRFSGVQSSGTMGRMLTAGRYKYVVYSWGDYREQLFDLKNDPGEMINLALDNRHLPVMNQHRLLLEQWCLATDDCFPDPRYPTVPLYDRDS